MKTRHTSPLPIFLYLLLCIIIAPIFIWLGFKHAQFLHDLSYFKYIFLAPLTKLFMSIYYWLNFKYYIDNEKIIIQKGIFNISQRQFLIKNVRQSNQHTPIIFRIFKHTNLVVDTGVNSDEEGTLNFNCISLLECKRIKDLINLGGTNESKNSLKQFIKGDFSANQNERLLFKTNILDVMLSSLTSINIFAYISIIAIVTPLIDNINLHHYLPNFIYTYIKNSTLFWTTATILVFCFLLINQFIIYGNFKLLDDKDTFYSINGFIEHRTDSFKKIYIKTIAIRQNLIMQLLGIHTVETYSASPAITQDNNANRNTFLPFIKTTPMYENLHKFFPKFSFKNVALENNSALLKRLSIIFFVPFIILLIIAIAKQNLYIFIICGVILISYLIQIIRMIFTNIIISKNTIISRTGMLNKICLYTLISDIEFFAIKQGPLQWLLNTYSITIVIRKSPVAFITIPFIPPIKKQELLDELKNKIRLAKTY